MVEETGAGGNLDGLVNCAGVYEDEGMEDITENQWNRVLNINLKAPVFLTQQIRKILNNGSSIVNVSSVMGLRATKFGLAYQAAKSSLIHVTRSMALSYAPDVRVNCIAPGYVTTEMNRDGWENEDFRKKIEYVTPMGRWGAPADIGPLAVFLLSPVSSFVTGSLFPVDGGIGIR
jgi:NAD(P)-dependent dehydrogenase (short-subunit alcohol dehydrogenase family)